MTNCRACGAEGVRVIADFGHQPISNRFLTAADELEATFPLALGACDICGVVQIVEPMPAEEVRPRFSWITYREPEPHLDQVASIIAQLPGLPAKAHVWGISYKEDTTLQRLQREGLTVKRLDPGADLGIDNANAGIETIQGKLTCKMAQSLLDKHGNPDVVIARHIVEHSHDLRQVLAALRELIGADGYLVLEIPDEERGLNQQDFSSVWEEHLFYFTRHNLPHILAMHGLEVMDFRIFPYVSENAMVAIVKASDKSVGHQFPNIGQGRSRSQIYEARSPGAKIRIRRVVENLLYTQGRLALLGAGHTCCTFVNLLELKDFFEFVVDDNPHKRGLFMPGSRLPIMPSSALLEQDIKLCLLCVSPDSEDAVIARNSSFRDRGGIFASISPASQYYFAK